MRGRAEDRHPAPIEDVHLAGLGAGLELDARPRRRASAPSAGCRGPLRSWSGRPRRRCRRPRARSADLARRGGGRRRRRPRRRGARRGLRRRCGCAGRRECREAPRRRAVVPRRRGRLRGTSCTAISITLPEPLQRGQVWVRMNSPKTLRETCCSRPAPPHAEHCTGLVPGSAPLPSQASHGTATWNGTSFVTPRAASTSSIAISAPMSAPRRARRPPTPNRSSPKNAEKRSLRLPKSKLGV